MVPQEVERWCEHIGWAETSVQTKYYASPKCRYPTAHRLVNVLILQATRIVLYLFVLSNLLVPSIVFGFVAVAGGILVCFTYPR